MMRVHTLAWRLGLATACNRFFCHQAQALVSKGVCVVVGAGPGLGNSCALKFARDGYTVAAVCRSVRVHSITGDAARKEAGIAGARVERPGCVSTSERPHLARPRFAPFGLRFRTLRLQASSYATTQTALTGLGPGGHRCYEMDSTDKAAVVSTFEKVRAELGFVNVLVYNAGGGGFGKLPMDIDSEDFKASFETSCVGALLCSQQVIPHMLASQGGGGCRVPKKGTIIYTSATSAFRGGASTAQFACGKFALRALSQSVAKAYGQFGVHAVHVRLDCILDTPGYVEKMPDMFAENKMASTDDISQTYLDLVNQSPLAWTNEIDIRPFQEGWSC
ncbi:hypothetical protein M885DRAFT_512405 [Pelagophyceae sp. CCMP2097]|nr:hypothetical protein M885DRAFT_512405 [Pelagophyceae sp. CCMP2097]